MTYNVFGGTLSLTQSINPKPQHLNSVYQVLADKPDHVHHDVTNPIHALPDSNKLGKYRRTSSSKTAKLAL